MCLRDAVVGKRKEAEVSITIFGNLLLQTNNYIREVLKAKEKPKTNAYLTETEERQTTRV